MSNTTPNRVGANNQGSDKTALFLKKFSGEILTTFEQQNIMKPLHTVRTISDGKSAQFPVTGVATSKYHTPGESLASNSSYLSSIRHGEREISIDQQLVAATFLANIDDLMNHYDVRSVYSSELGKELANRFDTAVIKTFIATARSSAAITGGKTGGSLDVTQNKFTSVSGYSADSASTAITGAALVAALFSAAQKLDENDVPSDGRFCVLPPEQYYKLITGADSNNAFSLTSPVNTDVGGSGSVSSGSIASIAGIQLYKSTHIPSTDLSSTTSGDGGAVNDVFGGAGTGYNGDFSNTIGFVGHSAAVGTVKLLDLATESEYQIERQGTLFVAKYAMGHGVLRPECAIELVK
jgi:hypothetical protein|tara:strand:+ start:114 stop:1169 length:1056 start_codon:yes stop_codon:yes gene_type:complete